MSDEKALTPEEWQAKRRGVGGLEAKRWLDAFTRGQEVTNPGLFVEPYRDAFLCFSVAYGRTEREAIERTRDAAVKKLERD